MTRLGESPTAIALRYRAIKASMLSAPGKPDELESTLVRRLQIRSAYMVSALEDIKDYRAKLPDRARCIVVQRLRGVLAELEEHEEDG